MAVDRRAVTARWAAPGRVNLIGEHVDYNDGLVLPFAVPWTTETAASKRGVGVVAASSEGTGSVEFPVDAAPGDVTGWAAYVAGVVWALRQRGYDVPGLDLAISSAVPQGAGLSSSAALTCSVAGAISDECGFGLSPESVAEVARTAENDFVGVATGAMDQFAAMLCRRGYALLLDCRSMQTRQVELGLADAGLRFLLINTGVSHQLTTSEYGDRRRDCEAAAAELAVGALRDATMKEVATLSSDRLRRRARHVVSEIQRVADVVALLEARTPQDIGLVLTASHESLRDDFQVSSPELDVTVDSALLAGALGARMVGGGFGGCVIALCQITEEAAVRRAVEAGYDAHSWAPAAVTAPEPSQGAHKVS